MKKGLKRILSVLVVFLVIIPIALSFMYFKQNRIIFAATQLPADYLFSFDTPFKEVNLLTEDSVNLNGLHFKTENPKGVLYYLHGNTGNLERWGAIASYFTKFKYDVLVIDYRTYGKSTGIVNEQKMLNDTQLWYDYLLKTYAEEDIIVYGRSIGTGFATYTASHNNPKKVILETPYYNFKDLIKRRFKIVPFLSSIIKIKLLSNEYIKDISCPITIYHGTNDRIVPYESGKLLSKQVPSSQVDFITIPNGNHNDLRGFKQYQTSIAKVLK